MYPLLAAVLGYCTLDTTVPCSEHALGAEHRNHFFTNAASAEQRDGIGYFVLSQNELSYNEPGAAVGTAALLTEDGL